MMLFGSSLALFRSRGCGRRVWSMASGQNLHYYSAHLTRPLTLIIIRPAPLHICTLGVGHQTVYRGRGTGQTLGPARERGTALRSK